MSALNSPTPTVAPPAHPGWTEADSNALLAAAFWFDATAPAERKEPFRGMHVAIFGEQIVDSDRDKEALFSRLGANPDIFPPSRILIRYVPTEEEAWSRLWLR